MTISTNTTYIGKKKLMSYGALIGGVFCFLFAAIFLFSGSVFGQAPTTGLVAHYTLDETSGATAADSAGANHGTLNGNPVWTPGQSGGAIRFDGDGDYVEVPDSPSFTLSDFTISYWVNPILYNPSDQSEVVSKWGSHRQFLLGFDVDGDYYFALGSGTCSSSRAVVTFQNTAPPLNQWVHVTWVRDAANGTMSLYENGVQKNTASYGTDVCSDNPVPLRIGARGDNQEFFNGLVDEVRVYNRMLSGAEVGALATP